MSNGREENGQFAKGNQVAKNGGGGRPSKAREERYYEIAMKSCTFGDWRAIMKKAVDQALDGDKDARKWLADYLIGPATKRLDVTTGGEKIIWLGWGDGDNDEDSTTEVA